jgi:phage anti-repressor protein
MYLATKWTRWTWRTCKQILTAQNKYLTAEKEEKNQPRKRGGILSANDEKLDHCRGTEMTEKEEEQNLTAKK